MDLKLTGKRALVCGASQGIGKACAIALAELGASVTIVSRTEDKLKKAITELDTQQNQQHHYIAADLGDLDKLKQLIEDSITQHGAIAILINNSGGPAIGPIADATLDDFQKAFDAHLKANVILAQACLPGMRELHYGRIINITSTSVKTPLENLGVSNTTRWAVTAWGKTLSYEVAKDGITVNTLLPGSIHTERHDSHMQYRADKNKIPVEDIRNKVLATIPAGYIGKPKEVGDVVAFLASPAASYINGVVLAVDGGRTRAL